MSHKTSYLYLFVAAWLWMTPIVSGQVRILPHLSAENGGFSTTIIITNSSSADQPYSLHAFDVLGRDLGTVSGVSSAGTTLFQEADSIFGSLAVSHFTISSEAGLVLQAVYHASDGSGSAHIWETREQSRRWRFFPGGLSDSDGLAIVNLGGQETEVVISQIDMEGNVLKAVKARFFNLDRQILPVLAKGLYLTENDFEDRPNTWFQVQADQPITFLSLRFGRGDVASFWLNPSQAMDDPGANCDWIRQAIARLPDHGGEVVLPAGEWTCSEPIYIERDHVTLRGQGPATILRLADGANAPLLVIGSAATPVEESFGYIRVADLTIEGNKDNQEFECEGGPCQEVGGIRNNGITLRGVHDVQIERVRVGNARSGGLVCEWHCRRITVRDFTSFGNIFDGLAGYQTEDSRFTGLNLFANEAAGLSFDNDFNNNLITNATLSDNRTVGIFMRNSRSNVFTNLQIRGSGEHGIFLAQEGDNEATAAVGNTFSNSFIGGSQGHGVRINDLSCVRNQVSNCQFLDNQGTCISVDSDILVETGNICQGGQ